MKTVNTPGNKAKFLMLHFGGKFSYDGSVGIVRTICGITKNWSIIDSDQSEHRVTKCRANLKPLSQISEEDAIEVAKLICKRHNRHYKDGDVTYEYIGKNTVVVIVKGVKRFKIHVGYDGCSFMDWFMDGSGNREYYCPGQHAATDYLRSKSYLIGYLDLTAEDILAYGWARFEGETLKQLI